MVPPFVALAARPNPGFWEYVKVNAGDLTVDEITATDYLKLKETVFDESWLVRDLHKAFRVMSVIFLFKCFVGLTMKMHWR